MEDKIEEVQAYFKTKILSGDFAVVKSEDIIVEILIDNKFKFALWVQGDISFNQWSTTRESFMTLQYFTKEEQERGFAVFNPIKAKAKAEALKTTKLEEFNKLKAELEQGGVILS